MTFETHPISFQPMGRKLRGRQGETIMAVAIRENVPLRSDCGSKGVCAKCTVIAEPAEHLSSLSEAELERLNGEQISANYRLACQVTILGPITVTIPEQFIDRKYVKGKTGIKGRFPSDPLVERLLVDRADRKESRAKSKDMVDEIRVNVTDASGNGLRLSSHHSLRALSMPEALQGDLTLVNHRDKGVTAVLAGKHPRGLGLAVDIGTTTLAAYLCDMQSGELLSSSASVNPQRRYGEDVISRIDYANKGADNLTTLRDLVVEGMSFLALRCVEEVGASLSDIDEVAVVGNTTMEHLFTGTHPGSLGMSPYLPINREPLQLCADDIGFNVNPGTNIYVFPVISGFVGGDTMGAIIADGLHHRDDRSLIVDIGGIRAVPGAISNVAVDPDNGGVTYQLIGESDAIKPMGLCGSGIIDAVATLRKAGIIVPSGRFDESAPGVLIDENGMANGFELVPAEKSGTGSSICVSLKDVRQIQLAKAALAAGISYLLEYSKIDDLDRTVLTGAFGAKFDWRNAVAIGMLPNLVAKGTVLPKENLAGVGAIMALLDRKKRAETAQVYQGIEFIELAGRPDFQTKLIEHINFPELDG
ncbi:MAG: DUF4445 domain-containing protein [Deltaproteobacteria bacterium]|nr:DUF4445 domain-containing protein [Deltaproteobacteria bacterium]